MATASARVAADGPARIHPTAVVDPAAELAQDVFIGPWSVVGAGVRIGKGTRIESHTHVQGPTQIGGGNRIGPFSAIGMAPQHIHDSGEGTRLLIGSDNVIREFTSIHRGTREGGGITRLGNGNYLMSYVHIGHDCQLGDKIIMANGCNLGGHTHVGDKANLGGMSGCHQFTRIGAYSMVAGASGLRHDVPPYAMVEGNPARLRGLNVLGLRRNGFTAAQIAQIKRAYKITFWSELALAEAIRMLGERFSGDQVITDLVEFLQGQTRRGVCRPGRLGRAGDGQDDAGPVGLDA